MVNLGQDRGKAAVPFEVSSARPSMAGSGCNGQTSQLLPERQFYALDWLCSMFFDNLQGTLRVRLIPALTFC